MHRRLPGLPGQDFHCRGKLRADISRTLARLKAGYTADYSNIGLEGTRTSRFQEIGGSLTQHPHDQVQLSLRRWPWHELPPGSGAVGGGGIPHEWVLTSAAGYSESHSRPDGPAHYSTACWLTRSGEITVRSHGLPFDRIFASLRGHGR